MPGFRFPKAAQALFRRVPGAQRALREVLDVVLRTLSKPNVELIPQALVSVNERQRWAQSPEAYLATTVPDAPNAYGLLGPNILVCNSFLGLAEAQLDYVVDALVTTQRTGIEVIAVRDEPFRAVNEQVQAGLAPTVFNNGGCSSYYLDARGKNFAAWPFSTGSLRRRLSRFDLENYQATPVADTTDVSFAAATR